MKKTIGIFLNNKGTSQVDVSNLQNGNPGMGGTQFEFFILLSELQKRGIYNIIYFGTAIQTGLDGVNTIVVKDIYEAFEKCNELNVEILISRDGGADKLDILKNTKVIYWVHNFLPFDFCKIVGKSKKVKRVVFVSYQHRDVYLEMNIAKKAEVIYNSFYLPEYIKVAPNKTKSVVFLSNIDPVKKLHVVTEIWPSVVKKVPDAKLIVIGSGRNGNRNVPIGPLGIAEASYEKLIINPLEKANVLDTVVFKGILGAEKSDIIKNSMVAVAPFDKETFCISALEYILSGTPVVGFSKGGINDVVENGKTGILCKTKNGLKKNLIKTLIGKKQFNNLPSGIDYFKKNFGVEPFVEKWIKTIDEVYYDVPPHKIKAKRPYGDKYKFAGMVMRIFRIIFHLPDGFSRVGIANKLYKWRHRG